MNRMVIDASVVLKWYLLDEVLGDKALALLENHYKGRIALLAPELLGYDLANGLVIAARRGRIAQDVVLDALEGFWSLKIKLVDVGHVYERLPDLCRAHQLTAYDASYAAVVEIENTALITADEKLYRAVETDIGTAVWLGDLIVREDNELEFPGAG